MRERVVLAYSGGLDTSIIIPWLKENYICEVIAMSHLLKYSGFDPAERFNERLIKQMRAASEVRQYLQEDNE